MKAKTVHLIGDTQRQHAKNLIDLAPAGYVVKIAEATRSDAQNRMMWPMIADLQKQVTGLSEFSADDIKCRFMHALGVEMRFLPALEGAGMFPVSMRSSLLTKSQFTGLIELMFEYGARHGVRWSQRSLDGFEEARAA